MFRNSPSWFNRHEVEVVKDYVELLLSTRKNPLRPEDIGIIAPYQKQVQKIKLALRLLGHVHGKDASKVMVGSTEQFQGGERRAMILSTVRAREEYVEVDTRHSLGFVSNPKRFNVAVTRAKALLIVIGHPQLLATDPNWRELMKYCRDNGGCTGVPPPSLDDGALAEHEDGAAAEQVDSLALLNTALSRLEIDDEASQVAEFCSYSAGEVR